jgi:RNA polymerase sigma-70 factor (ECF subfamily)
LAPDSARERFEELYEATYQQVAAYCRRRTASSADADDAVATTYLVAWRRLDDAVGADHPIAWLYRVAYRTLGNQYRARRRAAALRGRISNLAPRYAPPPEWLVEQQADVTAAFNALGSLSAADQELIRLAAFEGLSYAEIAVALDITVSAVRSRLFRARARLRSTHDKQTRPTGTGGEAMS